MIEVGAAALARVAGWPLETLDGLRSPAVTARLAAVDREREAVRAEAGALADGLGAIVPRCAQRSTRREVLQLRRAVHRDLETMAVPDPVLAAVASVAPELRDAVVAHLDARRRLATADAELAAAIRDAEAAERVALRAAVDDDRFRRALVVGAPALAARYASDRARSSGAATARVRRREEAVLGHLLRAVGRPVPSGLWAGVIPVGPGQAPGLRAEVAAPAAEVTVDPRPLLDVLARASGVEAGIGVLSDEPDEPWRALRAAGADLGPAERAAWDTGIDALAARCARLEAILLDGAPAVIAGACAAIDEAVDAVRADVGLGPWAETTVRVDWRLGWALAWDEPTRRGLGELVGRLGALHALDGGAELWRRATGDDLADLDGLALSEAARRPAGPFAVGGDPLVDRVRAFDRFGREEVRAEAAAIAARWQDALAPVHASATVALDDLPGLALGLASRGVTAAEPGLGPIGSVVCELRAAGVRPLAPRPEPLTFAARFARLVPGPRDEVRRRLEGWARAGVPTLDVVAVDAPNPGATLVARVGAGAVGARHEPARWRILLDGPASDRGWLVDEHGRPHLPLVHHAAAFGSSDPVGALLRRLSVLHGWELPAGVFPLLPAERSSWHHLPRLTLGPDVVVSPERWILTAEELAPVRAAADAIARFRAWRGVCERHGLPGTVTVRRSGSPNEPGRLVPTDSVLAAGLVAAEAGDGIDAVVVEEGPGPGDGILLPGSGHHVAQVVTSWVDAAYWRRCPPPAAGGGWWRQLNLTFPVDALRGPAVPWAEVAATMRGWMDDGIVDAWFFVRKPPGMRLRARVRDRPRVEIAIDAWRAAVDTEAASAGDEPAVVRVEPVVYEPEVDRFGGPAGMELAHTLFAAVAPAVAALEAGGLPAAVRYPAAALVARAWARAVLVDAAEVADVWERAGEELRGWVDAPAPETAAALADPDRFLGSCPPPAATTIAALLQEVQARGGTARAAVTTGALTTGSRTWTAAAVLFVWNAFGLGLDPAAMGAMVAALQAHERRPEP